MQHTTLNEQEIHQFSKISQTWWDEDGPFKPLHEMNPTRLLYLTHALTSHFQRPFGQEKPLTGLRLLDVGCGGGLVSEPLCRLGATMVGIDGSAPTIEVARQHAADMGLEIDYRKSSVEEMVANLEPSFDAIVALEVVEHVDDVSLFVDYCMQLLKPGGLLILSTINRTYKAYMIAIVGAEYIMRWLPRGTHDWNKFLSPAELAQAVRENGGLIKDTKGMSFCPFQWQWSLSEDVSVNYLMSAVKAA